MTHSRILAEFVWILRLVPYKSGLHYPTTRLGERAVDLFIRRLCWFYFLFGIAKSLSSLGRSRLASVYISLSFWSPLPVCKQGPMNDHGLSGLARTITSPTISIPAVRIIPLGLQAFLFECLILLTIVQARRHCFLPSQGSKKGYQSLELLRHWHRVQTKSS